MTFEEFAAKGMPGVLRFAAVLTGDRATAEDLAQEVLLRAYSRWDRIGGLEVVLVGRDQPEPVQDSGDAARVVELAPESKALLECDQIGRAHV